MPGIESGGVLHVRGPNIMKGYLLYDRARRDQPPSSSRAAGTTRATSSMIDEDDFVHIRGRVKRFAKIAGEMISLEVVERIAAHASPDFAHAASTRPDAAKGRGHRAVHDARPGSRAIC